VASFDSSNRRRWEHEICPPVEIPDDPYNEFVFRSAVSRPDGGVVIVGQHIYGQRQPAYSSEPAFSKGFALFLGEEGQLDHSNISVPDEYRSEPYGYLSAAVDANNEIVVVGSNSRRQGWLLRFRKNGALAFEDILSDRGHVALTCVATLNNQVWLTGTELNYSSPNRNMIYLYP
jgi:hypothetical protein